MFEAVDKACVKVCGKAPKSVNDCKGFNASGDKKYLCKVRLLSDNMSFTNDQGWYDIALGYYGQLMEVIKGDKAITSIT